MTSTSALTVALACAALAATAASAQPLPPGSAPGQPGARLLDPSKFQRVDQTFDDTDPLRTSLRELNIDLRIPNDFSGVYRIPGGRPGGMDDRFARRSGGLTAVFPRSEYFVDKEGIFPGIPAGTIFYLDGVPAPQPWEQIARGEEVTAPRATPPTSAALRMNTAMSSAIASAAPRETTRVAPAGLQPLPELQRAAAEEDLFVGVRTLLGRARAAAATAAAALPPP